MSARKVLIIEDDPVGRQVLLTALRSAGFQPSVSPDAVTALATARTVRPDAIVLDLGLPGGGGFTLLERFAMIPALSVIPVIVVSGQERGPSEAQARALGAVAYFEKPAKPEDVINAIEAVTGVKA